MASSSSDESGEGDIHVTLDTEETQQQHREASAEAEEDSQPEAPRHPGPLPESGSQGETISSESRDPKSFHTPVESPSASQTEDGSPAKQDETVPVVIRGVPEDGTRDGPMDGSNEEEFEDDAASGSDNESAGVDKDIVEDDWSAGRGMSSPAVTWAGPNDEPWQSPLLDHAKVSRSAPVSRGVSPAATPPRPRSLRDAFGASSNRFPRVRSILLPPSLPNLPSHTPGDSRAHALCSYEYVGDAALERLVHRQPRDVNAPNAEGSTPLHLAAGCGYVAGVELLLRHGAELDARDADGQTPVHAAAAAGQGGDAVLGLLLEAGADANAVDRAGWTPLHRAAALATLPEVCDAACGAVDLLLLHGADPWRTQQEPARHRDRNGDTPLHIAAAGGSFACVERLVDAMGKGCQEVLGEDEETPSDAAARAGHTELAQWLRAGLIVSSPEDESLDGGLAFLAPASVRTEGSSRADTADHTTQLRRDRFTAPIAGSGRTGGSFRSQLRSQLARWKSQAQWERERREASEADKARLRVELEAVRSAWERLEKTHEQQRMELEAWEATWAAERNQWNARWEQVQEEQERRIAAQQDAEARVTSLQRSCEALRYELESAQEEAQQATSRAQHAEQSIPALQQRIARLEKEISVATDRVATLERSQQETQRILDDARERNRDLRAALHASRSYVRALEEELATQRTGDSEDADEVDGDQEDDGENGMASLPEQVDRDEDTLGETMRTGDLTMADEDGVDSASDHGASVSGIKAGVGNESEGDGDHDTNDANDDVVHDAGGSTEQGAWEWVDESREWVRVWTNEGFPYYYNTVTEESAWELPRVEHPAPVSEESRHMAVWSRFFENALARRTTEQNTAEHDAAMGAKGRTSDPEIDRRAVFAALRRRDADSVRALFLQGSLPSPAQCWNHPGKRSRTSRASQHSLTVLHVAAWCADPASLQVLSEVDPDGLVDVDIEDTNGNTPLHLAAAACASAVLRSSRKSESGTKHTAALHGSESEAVACLDFLLGCAADATKQNRSGETPLHLAAAGGSIAAVERLLGYMSTSSLRLRAESGETALERAQAQRWLAPEIGVPLQRVIRRLRQAERQEHPSRVAETLLFRGDVSREDAGAAVRFEVSSSDSGSASSESDEADSGQVSWLGGWARRLGSLLQAPSVSSAGDNETQDSRSDERNAMAAPPRDEELPNRDKIRPQRIRARTASEDEDVTMASGSPVSRIQRPSFHSDEAGDLSPNPARSREASASGAGMDSPTSVSSAETGRQYATTPSKENRNGKENTRRSPQRRRAARWMALQQGSPPVRLGDWSRTRGPAGRSNSEAQPAVWVPASLLAKETVAKAVNPYGPAPDDGDVRDRISSDSDDNADVPRDGEEEGDGHAPALLSAADGDNDAAAQHQDQNPSAQARTVLARRLHRFLSDPGQSREPGAPASSPATPRGGKRRLQSSVTVDTSAENGRSPANQPASPSGGSASSTASGMVFFNPSTASGSSRNAKGKQWVGRVRSPSLRERYVDPFPGSPRPEYDSEH